MYGWNGVALYVDLSSKKIKDMKIPRDYCIDYIGGEGLGSRMLYDLTPPMIKALSPENAFIVTSGPIGGTIAPCSGRIEVVTKSPLSQILGDTSSGGFFGPELRWAGYDLLIVTGQSDKPVWLYIKDGHAELKDASHLWGKPHEVARDMVREEIDDLELQTVAIGPAAENLACYAPVFADTNAAAWTSPGTVLGFKRLKLIGARGTKGIQPFDRHGFMRASRELYNKLVSAEGYGLFSEGGVMRMVHPVWGKYCAYMVHNFQEGFISDEQIAQSDYRGFSKHKRKNMACYLCPIHCKNWAHIKTGPYAGLKTKGIEYWPTMTFPAAGFFESDFLIKVVKTCDEYGLCCGHLSYIYGYLAELYERRIITKEDTGGLELTWGNKEALLELAKKITMREGFGTVIADGYDEAAERIGKGADRYLVTIKGIPSMTEARHTWSAAFCEVTSSRAGDMVKGMPCVDGFENTMFPGHEAETVKSMYGFHTDDPLRCLNPRDPYGKADLVAYQENNTAFISSLPSCWFPIQMGSPRSGSLWPQHWGKVLTTLTGVDYDAKKILECGERIYRLQMAYNVREGVKREHFKLRPRFTQDAMTVGSAAGQVVNEKTLNELLDRYFELRGFDPKTGFPTKKGLKQVGLEDIAKDLDKQGLIAKA